MKNVIIAAALAVSSLFAVAGPSQAAGASLTITTQQPGPRYYRDTHGPRYDTHRPRYVTETYRPRHGCVTKKVRTHRNGHWVVRTTRVCR